MVKVMYRIKETKYTKSRICNHRLRLVLKVMVNLEVFLVFMDLMLKLWEKKDPLLVVHLLISLMVGLILGLKRKMLMVIIFLKERKSVIKIDLRLMLKVLLKVKVQVLLEVKVKGLLLKQKVRKQV